MPSIFWNDSQRQQTLRDGRFGKECRSHHQGSRRESGFLDYHERKFVNWHESCGLLQSTATSFRGVTMETEEIHQSARDVSQFGVENEDLPNYQQKSF